MDKHAATINRLHRLIVSSEVRNTARALRIGRILVRQKERCGHGTFMRWVADNCEFSYMQAWKYLKIAEYATERPGEVKTVLTLPLMRAYEVAGVGSGPAADPTPVRRYMPYAAACTAPKTTGFDLRCGDALEVLRTLEAGTVQVCVTSPPYYRRREYGHASELGQDARSVSTWLIWSPSSPKCGVSCGTTESSG